MKRRRQPAAPQHGNSPARLDEVKLAIETDAVAHSQPLVEIQQVDAAAQQNVLAASPGGRCARAKRAMKSSPDTSTSPPAAATCRWRAARQGAAMIALDDGPLVDFCKPAVDPLFYSAAEVGPQDPGLVLTGMGSDGLRRRATIVATGGHVMAQEATCVVWGMPGQVGHAGIASAVLPFNEIAPPAGRLFPGERP